METPTGQGKQKAGVVVIAGPTASGKSAAALALAQAFGGTVINADSMQVYREIPILTAQPAEADRRLAPHRLYAVLPAAERCSAGRWCELARAEIAQAHAAGALPILAGGTGMYLQALMRGLAPVPAIPAAVRDEARLRLRSLGPDAFHRELARLDPLMAARLHAGDTQRVLRAYEVAAHTGRSLASFRGEGGAGAYRFVVIALMPPRAMLDPAIDARAEAMMTAGAAAEVEALLALRLAPDLPAMKAVGVRELAAFVTGRCSRAEAIQQLKLRTRQYAKRQYTWFRHQLDGASVIDAQFSKSVQDKIFSIVREGVDRPSPSV